MIAAGISLVVVGLLIGKASRLLLLYLFSYSAPDHLISTVRLPFFIAGGVMIAVSIGTAVIWGGSDYSSRREETESVIDSESSMK
jgi:hypothetical protein